MLHTHTRCCHGTIVTDVRTIPLGPYPLLWPVPGFAHSQLMPLPRVVAAFPPVGHEGIAGQPERKVRTSRTSRTAMSVLRRQARPVRCSGWHQVRACTAGWLHVPEPILVRPEPHCGLPVQACRPSPLVFVPSKLLSQMYEVILVGVSLSLIGFRLFVPMNHTAL